VIYVRWISVISCTAGAAFFLGFWIALWRDRNRLIHLRAKEVQPARQVGPGKWATSIAVCDYAVALHATSPISHRPEPRAVRWVRPIKIRGHAR